MSDFLQTSIVFVAITAAGVYIVYSALRTLFPKAKSGCGGSCGCSSKATKKRLIQEWKSQK